MRPPDVGVLQWQESLNNRADKRLILLKGPSSYRGFGQ